MDQNELINIVQKDEEKRLSLDDLPFLSNPITSISGSLSSEIKKIDIGNLKIAACNELEKNTNLNEILNKNSTTKYEVCLTQSGYYASVSPLTYKDSIEILNSSLDTYEYSYSVYKMIYSKISDYSFGVKPDFNSWLALTSFEDLNTFYYGIFASTFPESGKFSVLCPKCKEESEHGLKPEALIRAKSDEIQSIIKKIKKESLTVEKMAELSLITKTEGFELPNSKIVAEIGIPSIQDSLTALKALNLDDPDLEDNEIKKSIKKFYVPYKDGTYNMINEKNEIFNILKELSLEDSSILKKAIFENNSKNRILYNIKEVVCPHCGEKLENIPVAIDDILFTLISETIQ